MKIVQHVNCFLKIIMALLFISTFYKRQYAVPSRASNARNLPTNKIMPSSSSANSSYSDSAKLKPAGPQPKEQQVKTVIDGVETLISIPVDVFREAVQEVGGKDMGKGEAAGIELMLLMFFKRESQDPNSIVSSLLQKTGGTFQSPRERALLKELLVGYVKKIKNTKEEESEESKPKKNKKKMLEAFQQALKDPQKKEEFFQQMDAMLKQNPEKDLKKEEVFKTIENFLK